MYFFRFQEVATRKKKSLQLISLVPIRNTPTIYLLGGEINYLSFTQLLSLYTHCCTIWAPPFPCWFTPADGHHWIPLPFSVQINFLNYLTCSSAYPRFYVLSFSPPFRAEIQQKINICRKQHKIFSASGSANDDDFIHFPPSGCFYFI